MSFNLKGHRHRQLVAPRSEPEDRDFIAPPAVPTYGEIQKATREGSSLITCDICGEQHAISAECNSKPTYNPASYFLRCSVCQGFHPKNRCWFEYMKEFLFKPTYCTNCGFTHIYFCREALFCNTCGRRHNFADQCIQQVSIDLSGDKCPQCDLFHWFHCPQDLARINSDIVLYCNRCKLSHSFMKCVPFCKKCFRRHREGPCPQQWTYCSLCNYCHEGETCPKEKLKIVHSLSPATTPEF